MDIHTTITLLQILITALASIAASSGFWVFMDRRRANNDLSKKLLIGLAHDRIIYLSLKYIQRGWVTQDEYENLSEFLYHPYIDMGGNGSAKRLMQEVDKLKIVQQSITDLKGIIQDDSQQQSL